MTSGLDARISREQLIRLAQVFPGNRPFLKQPPGRAHVPVVRVELITRQREIAFAAKDRPSPRRPSRKLTL